jgi:probable 2-oxoglutarate dehydrogenase E1 component DHKTD1
VGDGSAFAGKWRHMRQAAPAELEASPPTGAPVAVLRAAGKASVTLPGGFRPHDRLVRGHVAPRLAAVGGDAAAAGIDWATAEALAFGSIMAEGRDVRMSGQDAQRGTFSHRHACLTDQGPGPSAGSKSTPLNEALAAALAAEPGAAGSAGLAAAPGKLHIVSSLLSEFAVLGFEYGYSWESPDALVLWEAQFGDFVNTAQVIVDQFISGGESKWLRQSGLVMLLPHGYDGAGPEHSSARIERFLQLINSQALTRMAPGDFAALAAAEGDKSAAEGLNMLLVNPTTPANYFHALRRQVAPGRPFRKPLIAIAPKTLLRHPSARSALADMGPGSAFQPLLGEAHPGAGGVPADAAVERVLLCSGKVHIEVAARRAAAAAAGGAAAARTAIVRVEELAPFPTAALTAHLGARFPKLAAVDWVQEEPANAGAWSWAEAHLTPALARAGLPAPRYLGRPALPAPAVGLSKLNKLQQEALLRRALP